MSEYWVSNKKYYCKYCKIYITDNKISRQNHDNGRKHKEIVQMYIRDVQKRKKEEEKEAEETKKILQQIDKAAYKQYSQDCLTNENLSKKDLKVNFSYYSTNEKDINAELAKKKIGRGRKNKKGKG
jgi:WW domain-binding protein 4